jgi:hypothetical protein
VSDCSDGAVSQVVPVVIIVVGAVLQSLSEVALTMYAAMVDGIQTERLLDTHQDAVASLGPCVYSDPPGIPHHRAIDLVQTA